MALQFSCPYYQDCAVYSYVQNGDMLIHSVGHHLQLSYAPARYAVESSIPRITDQIKLSAINQLQSMWRSEAVTANRITLMQRSWRRQISSLDTNHQDSLASSDQTSGKEFIFPSMHLTMFSTGTRHRLFSRFRRQKWQCSRREYQDLTRTSFQFTFRFTTLDYSNFCLKIS